MPFLSPGSASDPDYTNLRDGAGDLISAAREFVESLWEQCHPFVDSDLADKSRQAYAAAFWELYLASALLNHGIRLVPRAKRSPAQQGPDLLAEDPRVWIDATVPSPGDGPDAVMEARPGEARSVPDDQIILRYRNAISAKIDQFARARDHGWIRPGDATVIAINGSRIPSARAEITIPRLVRAVLPFGHETYHVDLNSMTVVDRTFAHREFVSKQRGQAVSVDLFGDRGTSSISAVLASCADDLNRPEIPGSEFVLIHNPFADSPLPRGWFAAGSEFWVEKDQLHHERHRRR
jgi:type I restriction enzyme S subunit